MEQALAGASTSASAGALDGIRVLDFSRMLSGPICTQILADQGADVVKVEGFSGDESRQFGPYRPDDTKPLFGGYFASINRNKKSAVIDLKHPEGRALILDMVKSFDIVVENFRPGVMDRLGLGYETLREVNPMLVYGAVRGFGDPRTSHSAYLDWPAFDVVAQAMGGAMAITGPDAHTPVKIGPGIGDVIPGLFVTIGILSALWRAQKTGRGQFVDVPMVDAVMAVCERMIHQYSYAGDVAVPEGNQHPILTPFGLFQATDGFVTIAAPNDMWWRKLCELIGREELIDDPRCRTNHDRMNNRPLVYGAVEDFVKTRSKKELIAHFGGKLPFAPLYNSADIFHDPHFAEGGMLPFVAHPGAKDPVQIAGIPIRMTESKGSIRRRAPILGEHTDEVLRDAGYSAETIARLRAAKAIL